MIHSFCRDSDWSSVHVTVAGIGIAGFAAADALAQLGGHVTVIDAGDGEKQREKAEVLDVIGVEVLLGHDGVLPQTDLLVVSPGLRPSDPLIVQAQELNIPVWGELELAWRLRPTKGAAPWLVVTGTNGKTTTTLMLESMLKAAGLRTVAAGNIGNSLIGVVMHDELDVIAVEVGAPQLPFVESMSPLASVCLNIADDHIDHFGSFEAYVAAKAKIYERTQVAAIFNVDEPTTMRLVEEADVVEGCRAVGFTLGVPDVSMLGVVEEFLVDRAFVDDRRNTAQELATVQDVHPLAPHNVANALAAAALARAYGVSAAAIQQGLQDFEPAGHRIAYVATVNDVTYIDDSKATNTHAALTSLRAYGSVVWIAGGMAKGQDFDELILQAGQKLRGVVLLGVDRDVIARGMAQHAPQVPVTVIERTDSEAMVEVVAAAQAFAQAGDTVLLAPGCASWDMFRDYSQRGDLFAQAVQALAQELQ
ncbi:MAG: UDP-N-acetylmuramoyl-L-alanine--D-glutamate ligase [Candidatus Nanopelagicales bacterium]|nr:UDP-N-acetylmuramoyl-L-alanine--D-glutamate ligase [Candidatus Nanopelagicales bacterium]